MSLYELIRACRIGSLGEVQRLHGEEVDLRAEDGWPHRVASERGHFQVILYLEKHGGLPSDGGNWSLILACANGHTALAQWLVEKGAVLTVDDYAAFRWAALNQHRETVAWLGGLVRYQRGWRDCRQLLRQRAADYLQRYPAERHGFKITPADRIDQYWSECAGV